MLMKRCYVRITVGLFASAAVAFVAACGSPSDGLNIIPGGGNEVPLAQVDGAVLPVTIGPTADPTFVVSGKAALGEAIQSGTYYIALSRQATGTSQTETVSGNVVFIWAENGSVSTTVDLGGSLGSHTFVFHH
jgi:hypothetical protein